MFSCHLVKSSKILSFLIFVLESKKLKKFVKIKISLNSSAMSLPGNSYLATVVTTTQHVYFYSRIDKAKILEQLSPIRLKLDLAIPVLHYLGLITNLLCFLVLIQKQMIKRKSIFYLIFLAFSDLMYNFFSQLPNFLIKTGLVKYDIFKTSDFSCFFYGYRAILFHFYSVLITLFVTIERYNHIYSPLKFNRCLFNTKSKIIVGFGLFAISLALALPHGCLMVYNKDENDCDARKFFKEHVLNTTFTRYQIYFTFTEPVLIWFIPGLLIVYMNLSVIYKIFQSKKIGPYRFGTRFSGLSTSSQNATINYANNRQRVNKRMYNNYNEKLYELDDEDENFLARQKIFGVKKIFGKKNLNGYFSFKIDDNKFVRKSSIDVFSPNEVIKREKKGCLI